MKKKQQRRRRIILQPVGNYAHYFKNDVMPDYKKWEVLSNFISERGKIYPGDRTGLDRRLTREVKRARHLALLPFVVRPL
ncbi:MAG: hypothetical protein UU14_C0011G0028 [Candidatus Roizmanbacteria bacterium GW2011_GWB1_40_7]|uniref:30S ribosomal protein S18 n=1 Tax=Candidatus Roizmanbacteria bacterium GW2011_GWB1_40_7 TaxID=1618482 RepID=A0A0G0T557_9BACT|nr:MAG: hypothetical protein UU14_C0011G0028 [Candidatus Roizmanbacteria bacterium GW2011_GWB1_40_7]